MTYPRSGECEGIRDTAEHVFLPLLARDEHLDRAKRGYAMPILCCILKRDTFSRATGNNGPKRVSRRPAIFLACSGEYLLMDVMTVAFLLRKGCELRQLYVHERWELLLRMPSESVASLLETAK